MRSFFSSKPKPVVKSGFMGDTSEEQDLCLAQFKEWIQVAEIVDLETLGFDDYDLLRFCRARKFDLPKVQLMFQNFVNWRRENDIDNICTDFEYTERAAVEEVYPHGYHGVDKQGRPVYIERFGLLDVTRLWEVTTQERIVRHYTQEYEIMMKLRFPACSEKLGYKIQQGLTILDMTGGSVMTANKQTYGLAQLAAQVGSDYYPEVMGNMFIVNAPMLFSGIWAVVKGFLDEKTRNKIKILGANFLPTLEEYWDINDIPTWMGGNCEVPSLMACHGPWDDYEIHGTGIRRKQGAAQIEAAAEEEKKEEEEPMSVQQQEGPQEENEEEEKKQEE